MTRHNPDTCPICNPQTDAAEIIRLRAELAAALASERMACVQQQNERRRADKAGDEVKRIIISAANKAASDINGMDESLDYDTALKLLGQLIEKGLNEEAALREAQKNSERLTFLVGILFQHSAYFMMAGNRVELRGNDMLLGTGAGANEAIDAAKGEK